jgi:hypothetical protein
LKTLKATGQILAEIDEFAGIIAEDMTEMLERTFEVGSQVFWRLSDSLRLSSPNSSGCAI